MHIEVFYSLFQNPPEVVRTVLPFLFLHNLWYEAKHLFKSKSFLSLYKSPTLYLLFFQCHEICLRAPLMWSLVPASLPLGLPFLSQLSPSFMWLSSLSSSDCIARVSQILAVNSFFCNCTWVQLTFHSQHDHWSFPWYTCRSLGQIPLSIVNFCKILPQFITGRQGVHTSTCFLCVWEELTD